MGFLGEMFGGGQEAHQDWKAESGEAKLVSLSEYQKAKGDERIIDDSATELSQMEAQQAAQNELLNSLE
ncbi:MAG TPA: hypothetical protein PKD34_02535 [Candidatus Doudnabacteria bacterium]|nr:hypothetical protein [Candidatus Doudnabacteria bacterium]